MNKERQKANEIIIEFIDYICKLSLEEVASKIDNFKKVSIDIFEKKKAQYSLENDKFITNEINRLEKYYTTIESSQDEIMATGFKEAVNNSSLKLSKVFLEVMLKDIAFNADFKNLDVIHVSGLHEKPENFFNNDSYNYFYNKKVKDLNEIEVEYEIIMYLIWGINDCFYLKWLYEGAKHFEKDKGTTINKNWREMIVQIELINTYENNIQDLTKKWLDTKDKTGCAVYCNYLYDRKLFVPNTIETAKEFAWNKFGIKIGVMIEKIRKTKNKKTLEEKTEIMKRKILNTPYGKI